VKTIEIFHRSGSVTEEWLYLRADGSLLYRHENDGYRAVRHGLETEEESLTVAEAKLRWPQHADAIDRAWFQLGASVWTSV
jgi:hypothetical protein